MRTCSACGAEAKPHAQMCECGTRLPSTYSNRHPLTASGQKRAAALKRVLKEMRGPACVCGCRGPHECTRTAEWKQETLSTLRSRQL